MNAITINMPEELVEKIESIAKSRAVDLDTLITEVMNAAVREDEAIKRFHETAARGRGREQEALDLLRR